MQPRSAFTLIELLVVVTIIAVLLALLAPALERAVYQAELATCAARLDAIAMTVTLYAGQNQRTYPYRMATNERGHETYKLSTQYGPADRRDDRPMFRTLFDINTMFLDPLAGKVDYIVSGSQTEIFMPYSFWFSFGYVQNEVGGREKWMRKLGDRVGWTDLNGKRYAFRVLATDQDGSFIGERTNETSHPDVDGVLTRQEWQDRDGWTRAIWKGTVGRMRGTIDSNAAYDDGSVRRFDAVDYDEWRKPDERMVRVPLHSNWPQGGPWPNWSQQVPKN